LQYPFTPHNSSLNSNAFFRNFFLGRKPSREHILLGNWHFGRKNTPAAFTNQLLAHSNPIVTRPTANTFFHHVYSSAAFAINYFSQNPEAPHSNLLPRGFCTKIILANNLYFCQYPTSFPSHYHCVLKMGG